MARLSDVIEDFIKQMFNENDENVIFIQRNELADQFRCAPSQINYVLTTRFTYEKGYLIESKRGGGGHIAIKQLEQDSASKREELISEQRLYASLPSKVKCPPIGTNKISMFFSLSRTD